MTRLTREERDEPDPARHPELPRDGAKRVRLLLEPSAVQRLDRDEAPAKQRVRDDHALVGTTRELEDFRMQRLELGGRHVVDQRGRRDVERRQAFAIVGVCARHRDRGADA